MMDTLAMAEQLKGEYRDVFKKIDVYGMMCNGEKADYEDRLLNIYDMLLEAQHENKPIDKIIGKDIEQFCKEYFKVEDKSDKWKSFLRGVASIMLVLFVYSIVDYWVFVEERVTFKETMVDAIILFVILVIVELLIYFFYFKFNKKQNEAYEFIIDECEKGGINIVEFVEESRVS